MVAPVFREPAFVWACAALTGVCALAALAVWQRKFLLGLSEQLIRLPPSGKAVIVTAVVVATVFAQKPTNASTNQHESAQVETAHTESHIPRAKRAAKQALCGVSHGEGEEWGATNQHESARIGIRDNPCQSVGKDSSELRASVSPCETIVSSNDVVRGYRLETVRTNEAISYTRPVNARLVGTWHLTDAYRGRAWVLLGEEGKGKREKGRSADGQLLPSSLFLFPLGPHVVTSLWAHTWGKVRPQLRNASNEIVVTATFTENETDWSQTTIDKATAVKVELETVASVPENRTRHVYGVGERVYCLTTPDVPCQWTVASPAEVGESFGVCMLQCPFVMASLDLTVTLDGCSYTPTTRLVEPSSVVCPTAVALDFGLPAGLAGGVGLRLDLYASPDNVSFSGLALQEIPANGTHDGHFNSLVFTNIWYAQVFKIDSDGTTSVGKHGFEAVRGTNTVIRLLKRNGE